MPKVADDELWIPASRWLFLRAWPLFLIPVMKCLQIAADADSAAALRVAAATAAIAMATWFGIRLRRGIGLRMTPRDYSSRGLIFNSDGLWTDVARVGAGSDISGDYVSFEFRPVLRRRGASTPVLRSGSAKVIGRYLGQHGFAERFNSPPENSFSLLTADELRPYDPVESLRAVRRATVGDRVIRVRALPDGFRAETTDQTGTDAVSTGKLRSTLAAATEDAIAQVELARNRTTSD